MTIPVTLVSGFLGSGKTTLVRRVLSEAHGLRCAVIVNEFGALGIDGDLIIAQESDSNAVVELSNGCICCEIQDDLRRTLMELAGRHAARRGPGPGSGSGSGVIRRLLGRARGGVERGGRLDHILVEASGAASPGPAVQTFLVDGELSELVHLQSVLTLVHAQHIEHLMATTVEASDQVAYADRIVVNHADRVGRAETAALELSLGATNPLAEVLVAQHAEVPIEGWVLSSPRRDGAADARPRAAAVPSRGHTAGLRSVSLECSQPVDRDALVMWLEFLARRRGQELMRAKGLVRVGGAGGVRPVVIQGVYQWLQVLDHGTENAEVSPRNSRLVLIGRDLDEAEIRRGWAAITG